MATITARRVSTTQQTDNLVSPVASVLFNYRFLVQQLWESEAAGKDNEKAAEQPPVGPSPSIDKITSGVKALFANDDLGYLFVAEKEKEIVGVAIVHREVSDWRAGFVWYVNTIAVNPDAFPKEEITAVRRKNSEVDRTLTETQQVTMALITAIRAAIEVDATANGLRVFVEDPLDIMQRPFYLEKGQYRSDGTSNNTYQLHRTDSSAADAGLLCEPVQHDDTDGLPLDQGANLHREHYFMMTWQKEVRQ